MEQKRAWPGRLRNLLVIVIVGGLALLGWQYLQASTDSAT